MLSIDACQELKELGWKMLLQVLLLSLILSIRCYHPSASGVSQSAESQLTIECTSALLCPLLLQLLHSASFPYVQLRCICEDPRWRA